ncbi:response regulator [Nocardioides sp. MAH-18]|uniref:Response regulator n=1 Tax=Nocardioides agri TaxID=2682843 RepID=A0A6L6XLR8_9ACTN|nr:MULTISPECIES: response regulator transcription factor [unclassified Nocardioides]MBA2953333.1 response regulator transcription factor [Nocardioides sp. CGMCC 1.13656]MVQ48201.1 response regulator [Nocardioides sp. MAH-18]
MRIGIVDDSALFRDGLTMLLASAGVEVVFQAGDVDQLLARIAEVPVDVVILDVRMPPTFTSEGIQAAARLRELIPELGLLVLSTYAETAYAAQLLDITTRSIGYLLKDRVSDTATLQDALRRIAAGESVIDPEIIQRLLARERHATTLGRLTERERQVLQLIAEGRSNVGIARQLHLHPKTIEHYIAGIFQNLGLPDTPDDNRRVLAAIEWLRDAST